MGERVRKVRRDKKIDVKPTVSLELYECVSRISYITNTPLKDVVETITTTGFYNSKVLDALSEKLRRDFWNQDTLYKGNSERPIERTVKLTGQKKRLTLRFEKQIYEDLNRLAYCLDMTISSTVSYLLYLSLKNTEIVNQYIAAFITKQLDQERIKQLKEVLKFVNKNNPFENDVSLSMLINFLFDEVKEGAKNVKNIISTWLIDFEK